jgi:hypothetical protein
MRRAWLLAIGVGVLAFALMDHMPGKGGESEIQRGLSIAPVPLDLQGKNRVLVAEGSYLINAVGGCNDCHTCPSFTPGQSPFEGGDPGPIDSPGPVNAANYLAGGVPFGPGLFSANLTPDADGKPAGLTFQQFVDTIRTGREHDDPNEILQVMPWPVIRHMTDRDLRAIYEYLRSIPHAEAGVCFFPGQ